MFRNQFLKSTMTAIALAMLVSTPLSAGEKGKSSHSTHGKSWISDLKSSAVSGNLVALQQMVDDLKARVLELETNGGPPPVPPVPVSLVEVVCPVGPGTAIADAIAQATPGTPLTVSFSGTCVEDVLIEIDDITLAGNLDLIVPGTLQGEVTVTGAQRVDIEDATITLSTNKGVTVQRGAAARLRNLTITNNAKAGVFVTGNSYVRIENSAITNNLKQGAFAGRGSYMDIRNTTIANNAHSGIQVNRGAKLDVRNSNIAGSGLYEISADGAQVRLEDSIIGPRDPDSTKPNVIRANASIVRINDTAVTGDVTLAYKSNMMGDGNTITGNVQLSSASLLALLGTRFNPFTVTGNVTCSTPQSGLGIVSGDERTLDLNGIDGFADGQGVEIDGIVTNCTLMNRLIGPQS